MTDDADAPDKRILLVEDEPMVLRILAETMLEAATRSAWPTMAWKG
jgi:hypothetical protein